MDDTHLVQTALGKVLDASTELHPEIMLQHEGSLEIS